MLGQIGRREGYVGTMNQESRDYVLHSHIGRPKGDDTAQSDQDELAICFFESKLKKLDRSFVRNMPQLCVVKGAQAFNVFHH